MRGLNRTATGAVVIGAGQAGLAMSRCLTDRGVDHVVMERGRVGERWRSERWPSLRLLTPRWQSRLPGWRYRGPDPDGYFSTTELVEHLDGYARSFAAPLVTGTTVTSVRRTAGAGYLVDTDRGGWAAASVIVATGACDQPAVPALGAHLPGGIAQLTPNRYRRAADLDAGPVLVVGASATGVQLACDLRRGGHEVVLAVGRHTRVPRRYRGLDIQWWLDQLGILDEPADPTRARDRQRSEPSLQLVGDPRGRDLDLARLAAMGVRLAGRLRGLSAAGIDFADDLAASCASADERLARLLDRIDAHIDATGLTTEVDAAHRPAPFAPDGLRSVDLRRSRPATVVWATGYRRSYPWLHVPVLDAAGEIRHRGGVTPAPGLYVLGLPFLRRRKSTFVDGVGRDAEDLADHLTLSRHRRDHADACV